MLGLWRATSIKILSSQETITHQIITLLSVDLSHLSEGVFAMIPRHVGGEIYHMKVKLLCANVLFIFIEKRKLI
jgi:hypothetical protein